MVGGMLLVMAGSGCKGAVGCMNMLKWLGGMRC